MNLSATISPTISEADLCFLEGEISIGARNKKQQSYTREKSP